MDEELEAQRFAFKAGIASVVALVVGFLADGLDGVIVASLGLASFFILSAAFIEED